MGWIESKASWLLSPEFADVLVRVRVVLLSVIFKMLFQPLEQIDGGFLVIVKVGVG
jgi:hypothetical protein